MNFDGIKWTATIGTNPGYNLKNQKNFQIGTIVGIVNKIQLEIYKETNVYISCVANLSRSVYNPEWGMPEGGEYTVTLQGSWNKQFTDKDRYLATLDKFISALKDRFKQSTIMLEIVPVYNRYYTDDGIK